MTWTKIGLFRFVGGNLHGFEELRVQDIRFCSSGLKIGQS